MKDDGTIQEVPVEESEKHIPSVDNIPNDAECLGDKIIETYIAKKNLDTGKVIDPSI